MHSWEFQLFLCVSAVTTWALSLVGRQVKAVVAPPLVIVGVGILLRLAIGDVIPEDELLSYLEIASWLAVGFGVTSIALNLSVEDLGRIWSTGALITGVAMLFMLLLSGVIVTLLFGLPPTVAVLVAATVTPTDPVVASSIVTGPFAERHIPARIRQMLQFESGANDGLAYAVVFLPILLLQHGEAGWSEWLLHTVLWGTLVAGALGAGIGWIGGRLFFNLEQMRAVGYRSVMLASMAATIATLAMMKLLAVDSIWAAFTAGLVFGSAVVTQARETADQYQEGGNYLAMVPALILFGMALPWAEWAAIWPTGLAAVAALLLFRRLPAIALLYALLREPQRAPAGEDEPAGLDPRPFRRPRDLWFYGWFGPLGLSAVYYATAADRLLGDDMIWTIASLLTFGSIVAHGLTAAPFTRWYGRRQSAERRDRRACDG